MPAFLKQVEPPVVRAEYKNCNAATASTPIWWQTKVDDTHNAFSGGSGTFAFTCPVSGVYDIKLFIGSATLCDFVLRVAGSITDYIGSLQVAGRTSNMQISKRINAGQVITLTCEAQATSANANSWITITRIGG